MFFAPLQNVQRLGVLCERTAVLIIKEEEGNTFEL